MHIPSSATSDGAAVHQFLDLVHRCTPGRRVCRPREVCDVEGLAGSAGRWAHAKPRPPSRASAPLPLLYLNPPYIPLDYISVRQGSVAEGGRLHGRPEHGMAYTTPFALRLFVRLTLDAYHRRRPDAPGRQLSCKYIRVLNARHTPHQVLGSASGATRLWRFE